MSTLLERQIRTHVNAFVEGRESRDDFREWFVNATLGFPDYDDEVLNDLTGELELAFAEASNGVFDDEALRRELAHLVSPAATAATA